MGIDNIENKCEATNFIRQQKLLVKIKKNLNAANEQQIQFKTANNIMSTSTFNDSHPVKY